MGEKCTWKLGSGIRVGRKVHLETGHAESKRKKKEQDLHRSQVLGVEERQRDLGSDSSLVAGLQVALLAQDCMVGLRMVNGLRWANLKLV